jgi:hypothetical protein
MMLSASYLLQLQASASRHMFFGFSAAGSEGPQSADSVEKQMFASAEIAVSNWACAPF